MTVFGLTGNIGCGKSTVGKILTESGFLHIDADYIGRMDAEPGTAANEEIRRVFGSMYFDENSNLLRKKLGAHVFANPKELAKLNAILHPAIKDEIKRQVEKGKAADPCRHIVVEAAVLFEAEMSALVEKVILVTADDDVRLQRVMARDGLPAEQIRQRMNNQMSQDEKRKMSDYVIENNGNLCDLQKNVALFLYEL